MARILKICAGLLVLAAASGAAQADSRIRCGAKLVELGMTMPQVLEHCGEPDARETEEREVFSGNRIVGTTLFHRWTYSRYGSTDVLVFDQDKLVSIN